MYVYIYIYIVFIRMEFGYDVLHRNLQYRSIFGDLNWVEMGSAIGRSEFTSISWDISWLWL